MQRKRNYKSLKHFLFINCLMKALVFGTFDVIHTGHIFFLRKAREITGEGELIAVVARDSSVEKIKGLRPVIAENSRLELLNSIKFIDSAVLGNEGEDRLAIVEQLRPDVIFLGYDQWPEEEWLELELAKIGLNVKIERLPKFEGELCSSTDIKESIRDSFGK